MITFSNLGKQGQLGNQMFQIASTIGIAKKNNQFYQFPKWEYQKYFKNKLPLLNASSFTVIREISFTYHPIQVLSGRNYDLHGYFQSEKYFSHCSQYIKEVFALIEQKKPIDRVGIHIRRGDYLKMPNHHPVLPLSYYYRAMDMFKGAKFRIFSDDIIWCQQQDWAGHDIDFSTNNNEIADLQDISLCAHVIMANSSFSWWGAWLNTRPHKQVIAPKQWFGPLMRHDTKDLIPTEWKRI